MTRPLSLCSALVLAGCSQGYLGTIAFDFGDEIPTTTDQLKVSVLLSRVVEDFRLVASHDAIEPMVYPRGHEDLAFERVMIEGGRYTLTIPSEQTAKGQLWTFEAIVTVGNSETRDSAQLTIGNTPPTVRASLSPDLPRVTDTIVASGEANDIDGDTTTLSFAWYVNDAPNPTQGPEFDASQTVRGDQVRVEITANDGEDDSEPSSAQVTIRNSPPVAYVRITPENPDTTHELFANAWGEDPDGDTLTFEYGWTIDGEPAIGINPEFPPQRTTRDQVIAVSVVARDGRTISAPATDEVLIGNSPPGRAEVGISQSPSGPERDLWCQILEPAPDADRDPLTYSFTWRADGAAWTGATLTTIEPGDTVPSAATAIGQVWTCEVVASDGTDEGPAAMATSEIVRWTGTRTFTNCRASRQNGPSQEQCDTAYSLGTLRDEVEIDEGVQLWVVPVTGTYRIEAFGARTPNPDAGYATPKGARMRGDFDLVQGDLLQIAVGQQGTSGGNFTGGGGATWVMSESNEPLLIAGGAGGLGAWSWGSGCGGRTSQGAGAGSGSSASHGCPGKAGDIGNGGRVSAVNFGSGGGGLNSNGTADRRSDDGGKSWWDGLKGGGDSTSTAYGGFGGGGAGNGASYGGGGGGGYSGGDGGYVAGGGGSFNAGRTQSNAANNNDDHGKVTIELLD